MSVKAKSSLQHFCEKNRIWFGGNYFLKSQSHCCEQSIKKEISTWGNLHLHNFVGSKGSSRLICLIKFKQNLETIWP